MRTRHVATALLAMFLLALPASASAATRAPSAQAQVKQRFAALTDYVRGLPPSAVKRADKAALLRRIAAARAIDPKDPCRAIAMLSKFRPLLVVEALPRAVTEPTGGSARGQLLAHTLNVRAALLVTPGARACGGAAKAAVTEATPKVLESSARRLRMRISLPTPTFASHRVGRADYQQILMEGMGETGDEGKPGLPIATRLFGVPEGANVAVRVDGTRGFDIRGITLMPHQPEPVDQAPTPGTTPVPGAPDHSLFLADPFVKSSRAYRSNRAFPRTASAALLGNMRNLRVGGVDVAGARYKARTKALHVFTSIDVTVNFGGNNKGTFANARKLKSVWETRFQSVYKSTLDNWKAIDSNLDLDDLDPEFCGYEMLVVTSPALEKPAINFANARKAAGYATKVVVVGDEPGQIGSTRNAIQAYILGELNAACEKTPAYVVLFGDTSHVPTWNVPCSDGGDVAECDIASDLPYSLNFPSDLFADVQLGRIPAHDIDAANAVVNKIVGYETTPPAPPGDDFYFHSTVTAYFEPKYLCILNEGQQGEPNCKSKNGPITGHYELDETNTKDTRGFTRTAEKIQNAMTADGIVTDRVYTTLDEINPEFYYNGDPIPDALRKPTFPWNGTGADLLTHYNEGRSMILHRDHGWHSGWSSPTLHTGDVPSMVNGTQLPVVFGVDCSSAQFDIPGVPSFVEQQVMKPDGGAFAGFGDTRVSPTWANNNMAFGFFDAVFPDVSQSYGSPDATTRLGDILLSGKGFMATKNGVGYQSAGATYQEHFLYHLLGDPSAQLWIDLPKDIDVEKIDVDFIPIDIPTPGGPNFKVLVNMGDQGGRPTVVTLLRHGEPIGRGLVTNGSVEITPEVAAGSDGLSVAFEQDGALPDQKAVDGTPSGSPSQTPTSMSMNCPRSARGGIATTITGHIDPAFADGSVRVDWSGPGDASIQHTVRTDASGNWTDSVTFPRTAPGQWHGVARFAGDATHQPSQAECDVVVTTR